MSVGASWLTRPAVEDERGRGDCELDLYGERLEEPLMRILINVRVRRNLDNGEEGGARWGSPFLHFCYA